MRPGSAEIENPRRVRSQQGGPMVSPIDLWMPILLSTVLAFIASCVIHMVLGYHSTDWKRFPNEDGVLEAWRIVDPLLREHSAPHVYERGSPGPAAADDLIAPDAWRPVATSGADC